MPALLTRQWHTEILRINRKFRVWHRHLAGANTGFKPVPHFFNGLLGSSMPTQAWAWHSADRAEDSPALTAARF